MIYFQLWVYNIKEQALKESSNILRADSPTLDSIRSQWKELTDRKCGGVVGGNLEWLYVEVDDESI